MREIVAASPSGKQAVTNWPGIFPMSPFSPVYLQPPVHRMQGGACRGLTSGQRSQYYFTRDVGKEKTRARLLILQ